MPPGGIGLNPCNRPLKALLKYLRLDIGVDVLFGFRAGMGHGPLLG
jgi:hypothetical protein